MRIVVQRPTRAVTLQSGHDELAPVFAPSQSERSGDRRNVIDRFIDVAERDRRADIVSDARDRRRIEPRPYVVNDQAANRRVRLTSEADAEAIRQAVAGGGAVG